MIIEVDDNQERETWASTARRWYSQAIDKTVQERPKKKAAAIYRLYNGGLSKLNVPRFERLPLEIHARIRSYLTLKDLSGVALASTRLRKMYNTDGRRRQLAVSTRFINILPSTVQRLSSFFYTLSTSLGLLSGMGNP